MTPLVQRNVRLTDEHWADLDVLAKAYGLADRAAVLRKLIDHAVMLELTYGAGRADDSDSQRPAD